MRSRLSFPWPQTQLRHSDRLRATQFGEPIQNGDTDMQFVDLALEGSGHDPLAQSFDAVHLGLHQAASVVTAPHFPYPSAQTPACGDSRIAVHKGIAFAYSCVLFRGNEGMAPLWMVAS